MRIISNKKAKILLITHFNFTEAGPIHGPVDSITSYLQRKKIPYLLIAHPLYVGVKAFSEDFNGKRAEKKKFGLTVKLPLPIKSLVETYYSISLVSRKRFKLVVAIDPLNCFAALILKRLKKVERVVYYTVDYADRRFSNFLINKAYHALDRICINYSDYIWNVSTRIARKRKKQGVHKKRNIYVPNAPSFSVGKREKAGAIDRFNIMLVTGVTQTYVFSITIKALTRLAKEYKRLKVTLIGTGPYEQKLKEEVSKTILRNRVKFMGHLDHSRLLKTLPKGGLGLALYTNDFPWTYYGDSMKAREYLLSGLPVITTNVVSTADDIKKNDAGLVIKPTKKALVKAVEYYFSDRGRWLKQRKNAIRLAKKFDFDKILDSALSEATR